MLNRAGFVGTLIFAMKPLLLLSDPASLQRKLSHPPSLLASCYARFQARLAADAEFRRHHIFLPALLGDPVALAEAKTWILELAQDPVSLCQGRPGAVAGKPATDTLDHHVWCIAPRAMRLAAYTTWLEYQNAWSAEERLRIGRGLLDFVDAYVVPVLRARVPGGHNQQLSMTFCSVVIAHAFSDTAGLEARAQALRAWALPKFRQVLGLLPASGYSGEGATYQSDVVTPLTMWAGVFLAQTGEPDPWRHAWAPGGWSMAATLQMESRMGSGGGLLPPWDQYGWQRIHNLSARVLWASLSGDESGLTRVLDSWDEPHQLAWCPDDRLWTLLYWPEAAPPAGWAGTPGVLRCGERPLPDGAAVLQNGAPAAAVLDGWSEPSVGAAVEHRDLRLRVMTVWDRCGGGFQELGRGHVDPNHLIVELAGVPVTEDGVARRRGAFPGESSRCRTLQTLAPDEQAMIIRQYGSLDAWMDQVQMGFLGRSCSVVVDGWESYFPHGAREGFLLFERRSPAEHVFAGEVAAFYQPLLDVTRMRRTVVMHAGGVTWVVDEIRARSAHVFTWRAWLRCGARATGVREVQVGLAPGVAMTFAWLAEADGRTTDAAVALAPAPEFPAWSVGPAGRLEQGSERCDLTVTGTTARFVTCLIPSALSGAVALRATGPETWEARWPGGSDTLVQPPEISAAPDPAPVSGAETLQYAVLCDLDEPAYALRGEPDATLLALLDDPPVEAWRQTGAVMQTLVVRGVSAALPKIQALLLDSRQNYTVHSVAAWCLGRARYAPARETLRIVRHLPEINTALRARWALERIEPPQSQ